MPPASLSAIIVMMPGPNAARKSSVQPCKPMDTLADPIHVARDVPSGIIPSQEKNLFGPKPSFNLSLSAQARNTFKHPDTAARSFCYIRGLEAYPLA